MPPFETLIHFFNMGGYALYVWLAYGMAALVLVFNIVVPLRKRRKLLRRLAERKI